MNFFREAASTFSPVFYKEIVAQSFWRSFGYLSLLALVVVLIVTPVRMLQIKAGLSDKLVEGLSSPRATAMIQKVSELKIENGVASSPAEQPLVIKMDEVVFILDTTGQTKSLDEFNDGVLITKNKFIIKRTKENSTSEIKEMEFSKFGDKSIIFRSGDIAKDEIANLKWGDKFFSITPDSIRKFVRIAMLIIFPFAIVIGFFIVFAAKLFHMLFFSLSALIANSAVRANLKYNELLNICVYALTPATLLSVFTGLLLRHVKALTAIWPLVYIFIYVTFIVIAVKECKQGQSSEPETV